jgi:hypothetical protein
MISKSQVTVGMQTNILAACMFGLVFIAKCILGSNVSCLLEDGGEQFGQLPEVWVLREDAGQDLGYSFKRTLERG